jgi:HAE1 family hydrophobic/amphiphilic exporter-1
VSEQPQSFTVRRPVAVLMVAIAAVVFGFFSYGRLPVTLMPELTYPTLTVRTEYPGAAPEEVENDVSRPVEEALGVVSGLRRISSISRAGISDVVLELSWDTEVHQATQDVLERLDLVFLPDDAERPLILHYDPSLDPVMELSLAGEGDRYAGEEGLRRLRRLADLQVKRALEPIKGVAAVRVRGGLEEEIHVRLDEDKLIRSGLSIQQVIERLGQENINVAGGTIKEGRTEYMVRTLNEYQDLGQIADTVVARLDGRDVRIGDLGTVRWAHKEREILTRTDGGESVQIDVFKEADANIVALAGSVRAAIGELDVAKVDAEGEEAAGTGAAQRGRRRGPGGPGGPGGVPAAGLAETLYRAEGAKLAVVADRSLFIESSISEVRNTAVLGGLLAVLVLYLFLRNFKTTAIIAVSIPISLLITFAPLNILGVSLNIMSLGGLALGIGMLVDSSIVVLESIFRCREEGDSVVAAAVRGTAEVRGAVVASTLTTIAVFFPMVFVEGVAGEAFGDLGLAVVISLLASLAVAVWFIPMLASRKGMDLAAGAPADGRRLLSWNAGRLFGRDLAGYGRRMRATVRRPGFWKLVPLALLALGLPLFLVYLLLRLVLASLFELIGKLFLAVLIAGAWLGRSAVGHGAARGFGLLVAVPLKLATRLLDALRSGYPKVIRWALGHTAAVVVLVAAVVVVTVGAGRGLDTELLPEVHQGEFTFEVALPVGTPLEQTDAVLAPVERAILAEREHIQALILTVGFDAANSQRADEGEHSARFKVLLEPVELTTADRLTGLFTGAGGTEEREQEVIARIRRRLAEIPDLEARVVRPVLFSSRTPIEVEVHGDDLTRLKRYGEEARRVLAALPELTDVEATLKTGAPEVQIVYDRERLARYGLDLRQVAEAVRNQVKGFEATRFNLHDRRVPIVARLAEGDRETVGEVRELVVNTGAARSIPLAAVADVTLGEGPSEVRRVDGRRVALIEANIAEGSLGSAVEAIESALSGRLEWPADMTYFIAGQNEEWQRSRSSLFLALGLSIFLVYVIMAAQFESLLQPLVIMLTIPLAFFGTAVALAALDISVSVVVVLGMIMLAGIVVNNAIVLVDYVNTLRGRGLGRDEAIVAAGEARLRPILMTTATTVLGLAPMALGLGDGAEIRTPMAIAVISGLITSTVLTLIVVPSVYAVLDRAKDRLLGRAEPAAAAGERGEAEGGLMPDPSGPAVPAS